MQTDTDAHAPTASPAPTRNRTGFRYVLTAFGRWWSLYVAGTVDQAAVIAKRREEGELTARYLLMVSMSAGIAVLGLLQGSAAVVIGAMLLSPLMDPIMGVGFALAIGDFRWLRQSAKSLAVGVLFAVFFCALVVALSPVQTITSEIAARTRPNLFDLAVAIFSAIAGAYAMIRGREGTIVGVAIATALMPPLAVVGFGLATLNGTVFWGSVFLFITNLTAIALTATAMARAYDFSTVLSEKQTQLQAVLIVFAFVALAIPLFLSLRQIVNESTATREAHSTVLEVFDGRATISTIDLNFEAEPTRVTATVLTPEIIGDAEMRAARAMSRSLGTPVEFSLTQLRVGTSAQAAEEAQLAQARAQERAAVEQAEDVAARLALLAGVPEAEVTVDRQRRRAVATARPIEGATLAAYADFEQRIAAAMPDWDVRLVPPARALPALTFERGEDNAQGEAQYALDSDGRRALALVVWAQRRLGLGLRLSGRADAVEAARRALAERGISAQIDPDGSGFGPVTVNWTMSGTPD